MLDVIDGFILSSNKYQGEGFLELLSSHIRKQFEIKGTLISKDFLFHDSNSTEVKRFIAVCLIRIIGVSGGNQIKNVSYLVPKFILGVYPELCNSVGISAKTKTFEFEQIVQDFVKSKEKEFGESLSFNSDLNNLNAFTQSYRRCINKDYSKIILHPFLGDLSSKQKFDKNFLKINEYVSAKHESKYESYLAVVENIEDLITEGKEINTLYANKYRIEPFESILQLIKADFQKSPFSLPSKLVVQPTEKKYPFTVGTSSTLSFTLIKDDTGYAFNTSVRIVDYSNLDVGFSKAEQFIGTIKSTNTAVSFEYNILRNCDSLMLEIEVVWTSVDGIANKTIEVIELLGQKRDINWAKIELLEPYNLEPVEHEIDLVGRENILSRLKSMIVNTVGSAYLYGQRRVGKTSIVKTLLHSRTDNNLLIIYIEAGDWNDATNPNNSMNNLGARICRKIKQAHPKFASINIPDFQGSFNNVTEFIDHVTDIDPSFRALIILDEFDRISNKLYERGDIGKSFVLTIRSISNRGQFGFILVGGEKLEFILSQWQEFNKFKPIRVDYFGKDEDWKDFMQLIRKPVQGILEISDKAIEAIYGKTSGNPYFTKKICMELYNLMIKNRDLHVTQREAELASTYARSSANVGATDFSHFWEDGIKGKVEKEEETSIKRRKILIAIASLLKQEIKLSKANILSYAQDLGLTVAEIEKYLIEFEQRRILQISSNEYFFQVLFFEEWLLAGGVDKIVASFEEEERLTLTKRQEQEATVKPKELLDLVANWKTFKGKEISTTIVRQWLDQFDDIFDQRLMFRLLTGLKFYNELEIREKMEALYKLVTKQITKSGKAKVLLEGRRKRDDILVSYLDDSPAKGGSFYTKLFVDSNSIYSDNSCVPQVLERKINENPNLNAVVIIDDFIGSGNTIIENITKHAYLFDYVVNTKKLDLVFGVIAGFLEAKQKIEDHFLKMNINACVFIADVLDSTDKCFNEASRIFPNSHDRIKAETAAYNKGVQLDKKNPLGYNDGQATLVFPVNCPNNSLPILWKRRDNWTPLFERN